MSAKQMIKSGKLKGTKETDSTSSLKILNDASGISKGKPVYK